MPTYELSCAECGAEFDVFLMRMLRDTDMLCSVCGSNKVKRGIGGGVLGKGATTQVSSSGSSCSSGAFT